MCQVLTEKHLTNRKKKYIIEIGEGIYMIISSIASVPRKKYLTALEEKNRQWLGEQAIFPKFDYVTIMFKNVSFRRVLDFLHFKFISDYDFRAMIASRLFTRSSDKQGLDVILTFNGCRFYLDSLTLSQLYKCKDEELDDLFDDVISNDFVDVSNKNTVQKNDYDLRIFNTRFNKIKLDISGTGLDYLRENGFDPETVFFRHLDGFDSKEYHYTRIDVAYDLIDYMPDFVTECKKSARESMDPDTLRCPVKSGNAVKWSSRGGSENTIYFGSTKSERLLRIYDKKLQFTQSNMYASKCPYKWGDTLPRSWIRIELQCRNPQACGEILYDCGTFKDVFRYIYDKYAQREVEKRYDSNVKWRGIYSHWDNLFDWNKIPLLLQKSNFVQLGESTYVRIYAYIMNNCLRGIQCLRAIHGNEGFLQLCDETWSNRQDSSLSTDHRSVIAFENTVFELKDELKYDNGLLPFLYRDDSGKTYIKGSRDHQLLVLRKIFEYVEALSNDNVKMIPVVDIQQILLNYGFTG